MSLIQLTFVNIKRMLKDPLKIGIMFIMPIAVIFFVNFLNSSSSSQANHPSNINIAYNLEDNSDLVHELFSGIQGTLHVFSNEKDKALELLENNEVVAVYNIPKDFTEKINNYEKPIIEAYKREEGNITLPLEMKINDSLNEYIKEKILIDKGVIQKSSDLLILTTETIFERNKKIVTGDIHTVTILLIYFIILGSSTISTELFEFKKKNIISRAITTPNNSGVILGSIALALLFFQVSTNIIIFVIGKNIVGYEIVNFPLIFINITLASLFSITLSLVAARFVNHEGAAALITALVGMLTLFLSMFALEDIYPNVPPIIKNIGKFVPQYWIFDSLEKSLFFPNIFIVLLMILALFTIGSYKLRDFIRR